MNIIIPLGGLGKRFTKSDFTFPKPLVSYLGEPMTFKIIDNLSLEKEDKLFIPYHKTLEKYNFENLLYKRFPNLKIIFKKINHSIGAVDTLYQILEIFTDQDLENVTVSLDGDTCYKEDILKLCRKDNDSTIFYFKDFQENPLFSYIQLEKDNQVIKIKEKIKISDNANSGCYKFSSGRLLKKYCKKMLSQDIKSELYVSMLYNLIIQDGHKIIGQEIKKENIVCIGTPPQLREHAIYQPPSPKIFCFDLDNTLVSFPYEKGNYLTCKPLKKNILFLKNLKEQGHKIIIYSSRRMLTHNGDLKKILEDIKELTIQQLKDFDIPYDELIFGKPNADFYIDDLSINPYTSDLEKETGFYFKADSKEIRDFNKIEVKDNSIKKISKNASLKGEIYYYNNIPHQIKEFFPNLLNTDSESYYEIEKIPGLSFSDLYVNELLTLDDLKNLLKTIKEVHSIKIEDDINIYENYLEKLKRRAKEFDYSQFEKNNEIYNFLVENLKEYEVKNFGEKTVIHGDPVFTNIIISKNFMNSIKFIDMKGIQGEKFSIEGDKFYDYAKIYQSIMGYEHIIKGVHLNQEQLETFKSYFEEYFVFLYGKEMLKYLKILTMSLIYSLIPLHEENKQKEHFNLLLKFYENELN